MLVLFMSICVGAMNPAGVGIGVSGGLLFCDDDDDDDALSGCARALSVVAACAVSASFCSWALLFIALIVVSWAVTMFARLVMWRVMCLSAASLSDVPSSWQMFLRSVTRVSMGVCTVHEVYEVHGATCV